MAKAELFSLEIAQQKQPYGWTLNKMSNNLQEVLDWSCRRTCGGLARRLEFIVNLYVRQRGTSSFSSACFISRDGLYFCWMKGLDQKEMGHNGDDSILFRGPAAALVTSSSPYHYNTQRINPPLWKELSIPQKWEKWGLFMILHYNL